MDQYEEANLYFTVMEFANAVDTYGDMVFAELEYSCPNIYDNLKAYLCNKELEKMYDE